MPKATGTYTTIAAISWTTEDGTCDRGCSAISLARQPFHFRLARETIVQCSVCNLNTPVMHSDPWNPGKQSQDSVVALKVPPFMQSERRRNNTTID